MVAALPVQGLGAIPPPREEAWHHRARHRRAVARQLLKASTGTITEAVVKARKLLNAHHGSSAGNMGGKSKARGWKCDCCSYHNFDFREVCKVASCKGKRPTHLGGKNVEAGPGEKDKTIVELQRQLNEQGAHC